MCSRSQDRCSFNDFKSGSCHDVILNKITKVPMEVYLEEHVATAEREQEGVG